MVLFKVPKCRPGQPEPLPPPMARLFSYPLRRSLGMSRQGIIEMCYFILIFWVGVR